VIQKISDAVRTLEIESDADVAELKIEVDECYRSLRALRECDREVGRYRRTTHAALGAVYGDHDARLGSSRRSIDSLEPTELLEISVGLADRCYEVLGRVRLQEETARARGHRPRDSARSDIRSGHDHAALGRAGEDLAHGWTYVAPKSREVDNGDLRVCGAELVEQRCLGGHGRDEVHAVISSEGLAHVRGRIRLGLEQQHADRTDALRHLAIPNVCTR